MAAVVEAPYPSLSHGGAHTVRKLPRNAGAVVLAALPGAATVYLSFNAGGFFAGATGVVVAVLAATVALRMAVVRHPFAGLSWPLVIALGSLGFYSVWTLLSSKWSHAPARALVSFDLVNIYLFALILFGSSLRTHRRVRWALVLTWLSMLGVCIVSLGTRLRPDLLPVPADLSPNRLAFPLTYWNALAMFGVIGLTLGLYVASSTRESRLMRVVATAATPLFAVMILLTFSRAALVLGAVAVAAYVLLARPRGFPATLVAAGGTSTFAIIETYQAKLIANAATSPAAIAEGRHLTTTLLLACAASAVIRTVLLDLDTRLAGLALSHPARRNARIILALGVAMGLLLGVIRFGGEITTQWHTFTQQDAATSTDVRARLDHFSIASRLTGWQIALKAFSRHPVNGNGADTYAIAYDEFRATGGNALEAHSLYLQAMDELGLVGLAAILVAIIAIVVGCFTRARRSARSLWIALGVVSLVWAVHAGVDWDWQMPAVSLPIFALGSCALARRGRGLRLSARAELGLRLLVGALAVGAAVVATHIAVSERHLNASVTEFNAGDCRAAVTEADAAIRAASSRPQPYAIIGYCQIVAGAPDQAVREMRAAVSRDPMNWQYLYGLALADAAAGSNPHAGLMAAARLNPYESMLQTAQRRLSGNSRRRWRRIAPRLPMLVSMQES